MEYKDCTNQFSQGYTYKGVQYNKLIDTKTSVTTLSTIIFANGNLDDPTEMDENGVITKEHGLKAENIIKTVYHVNPAEYLDENQDLVKSVRHILMSPDANN